MRKRLKTTLNHLAAEDDRLVLVFGDISVFLFNEFAKAHPDRFYNLGICENTLVSVAAGLSSQGFRPIVHTIAPFVTERCLEQIKLDLGYNGFPATIVTCGATYDYAWDGPTHQALADLGALRLIPGVDLVQPGSPGELETILRERYAAGRTLYVRMADDAHGLDLDVTFGKGVVVRNVGAQWSVVTAGPLLGVVLQAAADLPINVLYCPTVRPLDAELLSAFGHTRLAVVHDATGLYEEVCVTTRRAVERHALPDRFVSCYGTLADVRREVGLDPGTVRAFLLALVRQTAGVPSTH